VWGTQNRYKQKYTIELQIQVLRTERERKNSFNGSASSHLTLAICEDNGAYILSGVDELPDELSAGTTARTTIASRDDDRFELAMALANSVCECRTLSANAKRIRSVLDIRATIDSTIFTDNGTADLRS
jgi:hypothetical protein